MKIDEEETYSTANNQDRRALLLTDDSRLPRLLAALLAPAGFNVQTLPIGRSRQAPLSDYTIIVYDGDPDRRFDCENTAVVVVAPRDVVAAYDAGADVVVDKPLVANVLMAKIKSTLRRYGVAI